MKRVWLICVLVSLFTGCNTSVDDPEVVPSPDSVKIGMILPTTGALASFGLTSKNSAQLAIKEINDTGGVNGKMLELLIKDSRLDGPTGAAAAKQLSEQGVVAIIGAAASSVTLYTAENQTIADGMPLISPSATSPEISDLDDNNTVWRTIASDEFQGFILANLLVADNIFSVSVIFRDDSYGNGLFSAFKPRYEQLGGSILSQVSYPDTKEIGFENEVNALLANGVPPAIVTMTFFTDGANFTRDLASAGHTDIPLYGVDGNFGEFLLSNGAPQVIEGMKGTAPVPPQATQNYQAFASRFSDTWGFAPGPFGESSYDAVYLIALAMQQAGVETRAAIISEISSVSNPNGSASTIINPNEFATAKSVILAGGDIDYNGASGVIDFNERGDVTSGTYIIWQIVDNNGLFEYDEVEVISFP
ncbi:ABC transporter substrate-binding protein [Pleionea sp. CnH1-48]|uniref:ABC transporter substrate-binding protein n=1 Tax=Pleionea sp. CnH1-48 TaxID=2954494 RepID=UPI002097421A|nr:ABC transporter substrate-binding protein [Pleionea sp. CnH1-48]MCO7225483.1 ABC transporter substrate-binding protein [Pleionea sp. CnH1-48]